MNKEILAKRRIEESIILDQLAGVESKINNLQMTRENLLRGLEKTRKSIERLQKLEVVSESS